MHLVESEVQLEVEEEGELVAEVQALELLEQLLRTCHVLSRALLGVEEAG
jgi:hypothetical protein